MTYQQALNLIARELLQDGDHGEDIKITDERKLVRITVERIDDRRAQEVIDDHIRVGTERRRD